MISIHNNVNNLPLELMVHLMSFLDDTNNYTLSTTCKYLNNHSKKFGYLTYMKADNTVNMMTFLERCCNHFKTLKTIEIHLLENPHLWLVDYVENIIFDYCSILSTVNPGKKVKTKKIKINDHNRHTNKATLNINWEYFPDLEDIELTVYNVNINGLNNCKKLKKININTSIERTHNTLPESLNINFLNFPKLKRLRYVHY
jgi:hypothetical protein